MTYQTPTPNLLPSGPIGVAQVNLKPHLQNVGSAISSNWGSGRNSNFQNGVTEARPEPTNMNGAPVSGPPKPTNTIEPAADPHMTNAYGETI